MRYNLSMQTVEVQSPHTLGYHQGALAMAELLHALERMKSSGQIERFDWPESVPPFLELRVYVSLDLYRDRDARRALRAEIYTLEQYGLPLMVVLQPTRADAEG